MKHLLLPFFCLLFILNQQSFAQKDFNCDSLLQLYPKDTVWLTKMTEKTVFCAGMKKAFEDTILSLKWNINEFDIDDCTRFSYERHGVKIIGTGETRVPFIIETNAGFNYMMMIKIRQALGFASNRLGRIDDSYISAKDIFTDDFNKKINKYLVVRENIWGGLRMKLKKGSDFPEYLNSLKIVDRRSEKTFQFRDLYRGVNLPLLEQDEDRKNKLFRFTVSDFEYHKFCRFKGMIDGYLVYIEIHEFLDKWAEK
jgi:hypothetical protein